MAFNSNLFVFLFLPLSLLIYYLVKDNLKNYILLIISLFFYAWGSPNTLIIIILTTLINYLLGLCIEKSQTTRKKFFLVFSLVFNIGILAYYKYLEFFLSGLNIFMPSVGTKLSLLKNPLAPIGLSYITFQQISYSVDIYKERANALKNLFDFYLYILIFPKLIAGPILIYNNMYSQIKHREHNLEKFSEGIWRFSLGLFKKAAIANNLAIVADNIFSKSPDILGIKFAWLGMFLYTFQIYFDFSGYSDMALGLGKIFGFEFPENFNRPYISKSITEFWRRWHISLSTFLREYVYFPLGGSRTSKQRTYLNLWVVFFISGLWHGAAMTFIIWGIYYGILLVLERMFMSKVLKSLPSVLSNAITFLLVSIGWVFFRSEGLNYAIKYIKALFTYSFSKGVDMAMVGINPKTFIALFLAVILSFIRTEWLTKFYYKLKYRDLLKYAFSLIILIYSLSTLSTGSFSPFIYFKF